jgi:hypothetical protein
MAPLPHSLVYSEKSLPGIVSQYESLRPCFEKISKLEALLERLEADLDRLERQARVYILEIRYPV